VVQRLNAAGIPVIAWQLLPRDQGYWFNINSSSHAKSCYREFKAWSAAHGLRFTMLGIDIEPDMREIQGVIENRWRLIPLMLGNLVKFKRLRRAQSDYAELLAEMRADDCRIESYHMPIIVDERHLRTTLIQRLTGLVDIWTDREVLMLYTSFMRRFGGPALLWSYARDAEIIGIGSTGGGVDVGGADKVLPLSWEELTRDLLLAKLARKDIHIFSLEGCVRQGFLKRLKDFDWTQTITPPSDRAARINLVRKALRAVLWLLVHPLPIIIALLALIWLVLKSC
jgi:hypothetical protein